MADKSAKLQGKLPEGDANGLNHPSIVNELMAHPAQQRVGIVILDVANISTSTDDGAQTATTRIRRIELITDDSKGDATALERLLMRAYERRTGATTLSTDLEDDVRQAFDGIRLEDLE